MGEATASLYEVFYSVQGEGLWVGVPQIFVRVAGCDLGCWYCDTAAAREIGSTWEIDLPASSPLTRPNPVTAVDLDALLRDWLAQPGCPPVHSVALTGGEPLLYPAFLEELAAGLAQVGVPLYLETGGHHPEALGQVLPNVSFVSLDYKLPSTLPRPVAPEVFSRSLRIAARLPHFVKLVMTDRIQERELQEASRAIAAADAGTTVVLQPVTGTSPAGGPPRPGQFLRWLAIAGRYLADVRVIPQCHKLLGVR